MKISALYVILVVGWSVVSVSCAKQEKRPNILFIAVDDLRADLGSYGNTIVKSPNLDKLASEGSLFINHFANVPTCGASRVCLLTGMRPATRAHLRNDIAEHSISNKTESAVPETFIHHLKRNGYHTIGVGKISHSTDGYIYEYSDEPSTKKELPYSWDELLFNSGKWGTGWNSFFGFANGENRQSQMGQVKPYEKGKVDDNGYVDGLTTQLVISKLGKLNEDSKPFFLGVGFFKPHLPFTSPEKYWNLYNEDSIPISSNPKVPQHINLKSVHNSNEFNSYKLGDEEANLIQPVSEGYARTLRHAYYSCVSYIDNQIGLILNEVTRLGLDENTIIVVWGDHGWHLGDQQVWGKHTVFENALKSALIIKVPNIPNPKSITSIVETVDIFPTLLELCNIDLPHAVDGTSFVNLLSDSKTQNDAVAYGYYNEGITLRTDRYRLTRFYRDEKPDIELYDHENDPLETTNIALEYPDIVARLMPILERGNTGLYE